jgi:hypothetical protein
MLDSLQASCFRFGEGIVKSWRNSPCKWQVLSLTGHQPLQDLDRLPLQEITEELQLAVLEVPLHYFDNLEAHGWELLEEQVRVAVHTSSRVTYDLTNADEVMVIMRYEQLPLAGPNNR